MWNSLIFNRRIAFLGSLTILLAMACTTPTERLGVPVMAGVYLNESCHAQPIIESLEEVKKLGLDGIVIEVPFELSNRHTGSDFRYYETHAIDTLVKYLQEDSVAYSIAFPLENPSNYPLARARIEHYLTDLSGILLRLASYPPDNIIFSGIWMNPDFHQNDFHRFLDELKTSFEVFNGNIVFAGFPHELNENFDWETPDVIGVKYPEPTNEDYSIFFTAIHQQISDRLIQCDRPAMIVNANLIGERKLEKFQGQLSFWPDSILLTGIVINSFQCEPGLTHDHSFFSLGEDQRFREYLRDYAN